MSEIKALEWGPHPQFGGDDLAVARVPQWGEQGHKYQVGRDADAPGYKAFLAPLYGSWFWTSDGHASLEDAKRAAQSDYEARIRSALVERKADLVPAAWREAVQEFVDRVERGEVRSKRTYAKFKELLAALSASPSPVDSRELIERLVKALEEIAASRRMNCHEMSDEERAEYWSALALRYRSIASKALAAKEQQP